MKHTLILGLKFFSGTLEEAILESKKGGLICFPSGPGLSEMDRHPHYLKALQESDLLFADSGLLAILGKFFCNQNITRISGYFFLKSFLKDPNYLLFNSLQERASNSFWVMPSSYQMHKNIAWLNSKGIYVDVQNCYVAPSYYAQRIEDNNLLKQIETRNPEFIFICLGGGIQEKLGLYLKNNLKKRPSIFCTGAAIAFLSGLQAYIPLWADKLYLGWLFRILQNPKLFLVRYWKARRLVGLILKHKIAAPKLKN